MQSALSCYRELEIAASRAFESRSNFFSIKILFKLFENFIWYSITDRCFAQIDWNWVKRFKLKKNISTWINLSWWHRQPSLEKVWKHPNYPKNSSSSSPPPQLLQLCSPSMAERTTLFRPRKLKNRWEWICDLLAKTHRDNFCNVIT